VNGRNLDPAHDDWARAIQIGRRLNEWADGGRPGGDRPSVDAADIGDRPEVEGLIGVIDALTLSRTGIRHLLRQGVLRASPDSAFQAELGDYGIIEVIGQGGMGVVLRAVDRKLDRDVALKIMRGDLATDPSARARFRREAKAAAQLRHPNIVTIHEVGEQDGHPFMIMEYVDGPSLSEYVCRQGALEGKESGEIFRQVIEGLVRAHDAGIIHRDIKSSNVLLDSREGTAKIADFGLAHVVGLRTRITAPDAVFGTPEYMSPEQAQGCDRVDERSDLYSAGVVLYEMLTGRVPFQAESPSAVVHMILNDIPKDPYDRGVRVDRRMANLAMRLLAKRPEDRFDSAEAVLQALDRPAAIGLPERRRHVLRRVWISVSIVLLLMLVAFWNGLRSPRIAPSVRSSSGEIMFVRPEQNGTTGTNRIFATVGDSEKPQVLYEFPERHASIAGAQVLDIDAQGTQIVLAGLDRPIRGASLYAIDGAGKELWSLDVTDEHLWPGCDGQNDWACYRIVAANVDGRPGDEAIILCSDVHDYPTRISVVDPREGEFIGTFWHSGDLIDMVVLDNFFAPNQPAIAACGLNNKLDGHDDRLVDGERQFSAWDMTPVVMILDPAALSGVGPPATRVPWMEPSLPYAYAFLEMPYIRNCLHIEYERGSGERKERRPGPEYADDDFAGIADLNRLPVRQREDNAILELVVYGLDAQDHNRPRGALLLDRCLNLVNIMPTNTGGETIGRTLGYWRENWRILVQANDCVAP
jgi:serine/threonine protein kinase